ncbi:NAD(P)/FAD-dependent oxidoreductase [Flavitalea sp.]|nr:NAD(P)/FAD-dependent oxidoreductase [Flavitalea sp.]
MKVIIIGGGFAGMNLANKLARYKSIQVTLVDRNNYNFFPPLLYQVSTSFIESSNISYPFRKMFQHKENLRFYYGSLINIDHESKTIETDNGKLNYDYLVLAMGTETNYFGMENVRKFSLPMKTIDDALNMRNHLLLNMETLIRTNVDVERQKRRVIVIAGGGPTGVELAGMIAEMSKNILAKDYPELNSPKGSIYLIDAGDALLGPMSKKSQKEAFKVLDKLGVHIKLNTAVKDYVNGEVILSTGEKICSNTLIWATGVIAREAPGLPSTSIGRGRRILVDEYNKVLGTDSVFAIGDQCFQTSDKDFPNGHPQLAQVAIQQGKLLAHNLERMRLQKPLEAFHYNNKGSMAIIAKYKAVVDLPRKGFFYGFFAWIIWLFIHIIPIAGYRNKAKLAYNWFWSFITNDPTLRLIIRPSKKEDILQGKKEIEQDVEDNGTSPFGEKPKDKLPAIAQSANQPGIVPPKTVEKIS